MGLLYLLVLRCLDVQIWQFCVDRQTDGQNQLLYPLCMCGGNVLQVLFTSSACALSAEQYWVTIKYGYIHYYYCYNFLKLKVKYRCMICYVLC